MGSMMADLGGIQGVINNLRKKKGDRELTTDDMLVALFNEVEYVWPKVGYPPLVTPFSRYVKKIARFNLLTIEQGKGRYVMMDDSVWGMILGKSGKVPGEIAPELIELAEKKGFKFVTDDPHTFYPDALDQFREEMDKNGWEYGPDDEELFELAMHPEQYRNYKSGQAKKNFLADLDKAKAEKLAASGAKLSLEEIAAFKHAKADKIEASVSGQVFYDFQGCSEATPAVAPEIGKKYAEGDVLCHIHTSWGEFVAIPAALGGKLVDLAAKQGREFTDADPHTLLDNALDSFRKEMDENGWEYGQDDEELFELAMHPEQYRNYKSGQAKKNFLADLQAAKDAKLGTQLSPEKLAEFKHAKADAIVAPVKGQIYWEFQGEGECAPAVEPYIGKTYAEGDSFCFIQAPWGEFVEVQAALGGKLVEINAKQGSKVNKGDVIAYIERDNKE